MCKNRFNSCRSRFNYTNGVDLTASQKRNENLTSPINSMAYDLPNMLLPNSVGIERKLLMRYCSTGTTNCLL